MNDNEINKNGLGFLSSFKEGEELNLKIPQTEINEILESLKTRETAVYNFDEWNSFYFTFASVRKVENFFDQYINMVQEVEGDLIEKLRIKGKEFNKKFLVLVRDRDISPSIKKGEILYMYYYTNDKFNTAIPEEIIRDEDRSEVSINVIII